MCEAQAYETEASLRWEEELGGCGRTIECGGQRPTETSRFFVSLRRGARRNLGAFSNLRHRRVFFLPVVTDQNAGWN